MDKYIYHHIQRTAGTALNQVFASVLGREYVSPSFPAGRLRDMLKENQRYRLIQGHFTYLPSDKLPGNYLAATLLRDPVERCLSWYYYCRLNVPESIADDDYSVHAAKTMSLAEYFHCDNPIVLAHVSNYQANILMPLEWDGVTLPTDTEILALSTKAIDQFDVVGVHESLVDFIDVLCFRWGWGLVDSIPIVNATSNRPSYHEISPEIRQRLMAMNEIDVELYQYIKARFENDRRQIIRSCVSLNTKAPIALRSIKCHEPPSSVSIFTEFGNRILEFQRAEVSGQISLSSQILSGEFVNVVLLSAIPGGILKWRNS